MQLFLFVPCTINTSLVRRKQDIGRYFMCVCLCLWPLLSAVTPTFPKATGLSTPGRSVSSSGNAWDKGCVRRFSDTPYCHSVLNPPYSLGLAVPVVCLFVCVLFCCVFIRAGWKCCGWIRFYHGSALIFEAVLDTGIHISLSQLFATTVPPHPQEHSHHLSNTLISWTGLPVMNSCKTTPWCSQQKPTTAFICPPFSK